jgi:nucleoside-diphosphate-sugar epimerase
VSRILVTGIEGFAGGHLARHLSSVGHSVIGLHWAEPNEALPAELHKGDIRDFDGMTELIRTTQPEGIISPASVPSPRPRPIPRSPTK